MDKAKRPLCRDMRKSGNKPKYRKTATFDLETDGLYGDFIIAGCYLETGEYQTFDSVSGLIDFFLSRKGREYDFYAHNGSGYDFNYLLDEMRVRFHEGHIVQVIPTLQGASRVIGITLSWKVDSGRIYKVRLIDSLPLLNMTLKQATKTWSPDLLKKDIGLDSGVTFDPTNSEHMEYLYVDCKALLFVLQKFRDEMWDLFRCKCAMTAGSTAMRAWIESLEPGKVYWRQTPQVEMFLRRSYYGGYVYPGKFVGKVEGYKSVDYAAAYGAKMKKKFPVGPAIHTYSFKEGCIGFYHVLAHVPDEILVPCIAYRTEQGIMWATGDFETVIDSETLQFAEKRGCSFEIIEGYYFVQEEYLFLDFINTCEQLELMNGGKYKPTAKLMRNSLYGKFGLKPLQNKVILSYDLMEGAALYIDPHTGKEVDGVQVTQEVIDEPYMQPHWASLVTSRQRLTLIEGIEQALLLGSETVYSDTDSIKARADVVDQMLAIGTIQEGKGYGFVKVEAYYDELIILAPKVYCGKKRDAERCEKCKEKPIACLSCGYDMKAKGVPHGKLHPEMYEQALEGSREQVQFDASNNIYRRITHPDLPIKKVDGRKRKMSDIINSHGWLLDARGFIRPRHVTKEEHNYAVTI